VRSPLVPLVAVVVGAATAAVGTTAHLVQVRVGSVWLPVGVALALALTGAAEVWLGAWSRSRAALVVCGVTWLVMCLLFAVPRPEGDLLLGATARGYAWLVLGAALPGLVAFLPSTVPYARPRSPVGR
jgi:hypothetical protein